MHGIELLLANCDQLTSLMDLTYFEGISENELKQLHKRVKKQNLNLVLEEVSTNLYDVSDSNFMNYKLKDKYPAYDNSPEWANVTSWFANFGHQGAKIVEEISLSMLNHVIIVLQEIKTVPKKASNYW